jgi:tol-pal system protein YbgF
MKKILISLLILPMVVIGINSADAASKVERDLEEMKRRLEMVEQSTIGKGPGRLTAIEERQEAATRAQAEQQAELDALRVEFQRLRGEFDDLEHTRKELHDLLNMIRSEMELKFNALEEKLTKLEATPAPAPEPTTPEINPATEYEAALKLIQKDGEFSHGRKGLQAFLKKFPGHDLAVNASYWIGEAYYGEKKFESAILQFQDVLKKHPQHTKASAAQLKQALAFQALGDKETAVVLLKKVVKNYPDSPEAKKAQERLK